MAGREVAATGQRLDRGLVEAVPEPAQDARGRYASTGVESDAQANLAFDAGALCIRGVGDRSAAGVGVDLRHRLDRELAAGARLATRRGRTAARAPALAPGSATPVPPRAGGDRRARVGGRLHRETVDRRQRRRPAGRRIHRRRRRRDRLRGGGHGHLARDGARGALRCGPRGRRLRRRRWRGSGPLELDLDGPRADRDRAGTLVGDHERHHCVNSDGHHRGDDVGATRHASYRYRCASVLRANLATPRLFTTSTRCMTRP